MKGKHNHFFYKLNDIPIRKSIRILFLLFFLVPVITVSAICCFFLFDEMLKKEMSDIQKNLEQTELVFDNTLRQIKKLSDRIYVNKQLQAVMLKEYKDIQDLYSDYASMTFFENYLQTYNEVESYRIYTENQTLLDNQFIIKADKNIMAEDWYQNAKLYSGQAYWVYKTDSISKKKYLSLIRSIWSTSTGQFCGVLVINIAPDVIEKNLSNLFYKTVITYDNSILYTSIEDLAEEDEKILIEYTKNPVTSKKIQTIKLNNEKVGLFHEKFVPKNTISIYFSIIYIIPIFELTKVTLKILAILIVVILLLISFSFLVLTIFSNYIDKRVSKVQIGITKVVDNNLEIEPTIGGKDEFEQIYESIYEMAVNLKDLINKLYVQNLEKEQLAARQNEISLKMLSTQINPHFLFNTLETIRMKVIASGEKEVALMLKLLASLLRYNLSVKGQPGPLIDELNAVQNYLTIQHMRFGERVSYDVMTMCDINNINVLPFLIQPIVENSFSHGLEDKVSGGFIYIIINMETNEANGQNILNIEVKDNGCGIPEEKLDDLNKKLNCGKPEEYSSSIGLINVQSRIKIFYGQEYGISICSKLGEGTSVRIRIPVL